MDNTATAQKQSIKGSESKPREKRQEMLRKGNLPSQPKPFLFIIAAVTAYAVGRILLLPQSEAILNAFDHDSAYLGIVTRNLLEGSGYINQAHWVVFLMPESLPMPYHNANPLFPTLAAFVSFIASPVVSLSPISAGYLISALSGALLLFGIAAFTFRYSESIVRSLLVGVAVAHFPVLFSSSISYLTDALFTALFVCFALALTSQSKHSRWIAGTLFGLTWLTRGQAILALPAVFLLVWLRALSGERIKSSLQYLIPFLISALVVMSPWLIRNQIVWGKATYSDSSVYLFQDLHAKDLQRPGEPLRKSVERVWHSAERPLSPIAVISSDPVGFAGHMLKALPMVARRTLAGWSSADPSAALLLLVGVALFFVLIRPRLNPVNIALLLYCLTVFGVFAVRPYSFEFRYLHTVCVLVAALSVYGYLQAGAVAREAIQGAGVLNRTWIVAPLAGMILWFLLIPLQLTALFQKQMAISQKRMQYYSLAQRVNENYTLGSPVVVGFKPYFYSHATSASALSIPEKPLSVEDESVLLEYMDRYNAQYVLLTDSELTFWRPEWKENPPAGFFLMKRFSNAYLWRKEQ
jgi:hypothetical protein